MRFLSALLLASLFVLPACKSRKEPETYTQVQNQAPDAKPTLYVSEGDKRFVAAPGGGARQVHYYSREKDRTYVVDEGTGKVVSTYASKEMPEVVILEGEE